MFIPTARTGIPDEEMIFLAFFKAGPDDEVPQDVIL